MNKKSLLLIIFLVVLAAACIAAVWSTANNKQSFISVQIDSKGKTQEDIATILFKEYLRTFKDRGLPVGERIFDYRIDKITIVNQSDTILNFSIEYSVQYEIETDQKKEHILQWTDVIVKYVELRREGDLYTILSVK